MGQGLDLTINRLPARTWNWLRMNEADLKQIEAGESPTVITEGLGEAEPWNEDISVLPTGMGKIWTAWPERPGQRRSGFSPGP
ncbi:MAG: hypothetical protein ACLTZG_26110 [Hungatella hathewayi]|uniref:hypothetical protein n=1 Tax=Hungatella hathewayi TaxID=154046 RepID=UPI0039938A2B